MIPAWRAMALATAAGPEPCAGPCAVTKTVFDPTAAAGRQGQSVNTRGLQRVTDIVRDNANDTALLREMATSARRYITSFNWCPPISACCLAFGVGGIAAIFFFEFTSRILNSDDRLWVVIGDLPSAYLVVELDGQPFRRWTG